MRWGLDSAEMRDGTVVRTSHIIFPNGSVAATCDWDVARALTLASMEARNV